MLGTAVNAAAIIAGGVLGATLRLGLPDRIRRTTMQAIGLAVVLIGLDMALQTTNVLIVVGSVVLGGVVGEWANIEERLLSAGRWLERALVKDGPAQAAAPSRATIPPGRSEAEPVGTSEAEVGEPDAVSRASATPSLAPGFVHATLVYCVGAMAIVGSLEDGLRGDPRTLFAKAILDGVSAVVFGAGMGIGVALSAVSVLIYQGTITLLAGWIAPLLTAAMLTELSATGGLLITAIGLNLLDVVKIRVGNLLPGIFLAPVFVAIAAVIGR